MLNNILQRRIILSNTLVICGFICLIGWIIFGICSGKEPHTNNKILKWIFKYSFRIFISFIALTFLFLINGIFLSPYGEVYDGDVNEINTYEVYENNNREEDYYKTQCAKIGYENLCVINNKPVEVHAFEKITITEDTKYLCTKDFVKYYSNEFNETNNSCLDITNTKVFNVDTVKKLNDLIIKDGFKIE